MYRLNIAIDVESHYEVVQHIQEHIARLLTTMPGTRFEFNVIQVGVDHAMSFEAPGSHRHSHYAPSHTHMPMPTVREMSGIFRDGSYQLEEPKVEQEPEEFIDEGEMEV